MRALLRYFVCLGAGALVVAALACGRRQPVLTLAAGGAPSEVAFWQELAAEFTDSTGIAVEFRRQPTDSDQRRQGLVVALAAGQPDPDVFLMDVVWIAQFAASGWLRPLDRDPTPFLDRVVDLVDRYRGELIALPIYVDAGLLYYRTDLLREYGYGGPPTTWPELVEQASRVQRARREAGDDEFAGFVWQGAQYEGLVCTYLEFAGPGGGFVLRDDSVVVDTPADVRALTFMRDLIRRYGVSPPHTCTQMREEEVREAFQRGDALFERNWPYAWALHQEAGSPVAGRVGIAPLPAWPGGKPAATLGGYHVGISRTTDVPEQAARLVAFLTSHTVQKRLALELGWNPGRDDVYTDPQVREELPHLTTLREVFDHAVARPVLPYYTQLSQVLQRRLNAALAEQMQPDAALRAAQRELDRVVARYGGLGTSP